MSELFGRSEQGANGILWSIYEGRESDFVNSRIVASFSDRKKAWLDETYFLPCHTAPEAARAISEAVLEVIE